MQDEKIFLMFFDLDSTFEQYSKKDAIICYNKNQNQFKNFVDFVEKFKNKYKINIKIHFISGVDKNDLKNRLNYFAKNFPNSIFNLIDDSVISSGVVCNKFAQVIGRCDTDKSQYSKADGINYLLRNYHRSSIIGACFVGDGKQDATAFEMIKQYRFPMGSFALACRSAYDYEYIKNKVNFYSHKPRIFGCVETLVMMDKFIEKTNNFDKK